MMEMASPLGLTSSSAFPMLLTKPGSVTHDSVFFTPSIEWVRNNPAPTSRCVGFTKKAYIEDPCFAALKAGATARGGRADELLSPGLTFEEAFKRQHDVIAAGMKSPSADDGSRASIMSITSSTPLHEEDS